MAPTNRLIEARRAQLRTEEQAGKPGDGKGAAARDRPDTPKPKAPRKPKA